MDLDQLGSKMEEILRRELDLFREMEQHSREQIALLSADSPDVEKVAELMAKKQAIVERLDELDATSKGTKANWDQVGQDVAEENRKPVRRVASEITEVLETLMALEKDNEEKLRCCAAEVNRELASMQRARLASRAYYAARFGPEDARFLDRRR
ncbi:MAG: flagellar export chaperone FlgN [bacterium]